MPSQVILFYQPRSACRVMMRMALDKQDNIDIYSAVFSQARGMQVGWLRSDEFPEVSNEYINSLEEAIGKDVADWQLRLEQAQAAQKLLVVQTYPFAPVSPERVIEFMRATTKTESGSALSGENFTLIPESLLLTPGTIPVFVIRNPRMAVPSAFRVLKNMGLTEGGGRSMALMTTCNIWSRVLYDFYVKEGFTPLVLDAEDYLSSETYVREICKSFGLDPSKSQFSWPAMSEEEKSKLHPMEFLSAEELFKSTGPDAGRIEENMQSELTSQHQEQEFGQDAALIHELVGYAMPHYEYLREKRLQL